jgi:uncharacterized protein
VPAFAGANGETDLDTKPAYFTWYELITTDVTAAAAFYRDVVGWGAKAVSASQPPYTLFTMGELSTAGLMELPEEGRKMGATPRWMGYVAVHDVQSTSERIRKSGGRVYVPPVDTNIGRISVVADPYTAAFGIADRLQVTPQQASEGGKPGRIGWHDLFAADLNKEAAFYSEVFGWEINGTKHHSTNDYISFAASDQVFAGAMDKGPVEPDPFWLFYINVEDIDAAAERVSKGGGLISQNEKELPGGFWTAHCSDPQGAAFGLQGKRGHSPLVGWSTEWQGFSSRGQLVTPKPRPKN